MLNPHPSAGIADIYIIYICKYPFLSLRRVPDPLTPLSLSLESLMIGRLIDVSVQQDSSVRCFGEMSNEWSSPSHLIDVMTTGACSLWWWLSYVPLIQRIKMFTNHHQIIKLHALSIQFLSTYNSEKNVYIMPSLRNCAQLETAKS